MSDGRQNNGGARPNSGPKPWGLRSLITKKIEELTPSYFLNLQEALSSEDPAEKRAATQEMTKLVSKYIPTTIDGDGDGGAIKITISKDIADKNLLDGPNVTTS